MKKYVLTFLILLILPFSCFPRLALRTVRADDIPTSGSYACILSDSAFFYASADGKRGVFLLPKTYYVRLVEYGTELCKIEYLSDDDVFRKVVGYVRTAQLAFVDYIPQQPYLYYTLDVCYRIEDAETGNSSFLTDITVNCVYYGDYLIGSEVYCYVLRGSTFGYIPKPSSVSYSENGEYADYLAAQAAASAQSDSSETVPESGVNSLQIALIILLCLLVPVLAALILKPPKSPFAEPPDE